MVENKTIFHLKQQKHISNYDQVKKKREPIIADNFILSKQENIQCFFKDCLMLMIAQ